MKIKCPICGFEVDNDTDLYIHLESEAHSKAHVANALTKQTFNIYKNIEELEPQNEDNAFCESGENLSGQVGLLKSLIE